MPNPLKIRRFGRYAECARLLLKYGGREFLTGERMEAFEVRFLQAHTSFGQRDGGVGMVGEFRRLLLRDLDYRLEARPLAVIAKNLPGFERIVVPAPVEDYVTRRLNPAGLAARRQGATISSKAVAGPGDSAASTRPTLPG